MDRRTKHKPKTPTISFLRLKIYEMYRDGHNFFEIGNQLSLNAKVVESHLIAYINAHQVDVDKLEHDRSTIIKLDAHLNHRPVNNTKYRPYVHNKCIINEDEIAKLLATPDESEQHGYGFKSNPEPHLSWFDKAKLELYHFFFFWK